nr:uncharacterized protein LOC117991270 isoform X2 [Maniola hyperantus]
MQNYLLHEDLWFPIVGYPEGDTNAAPVKIRNDAKALAKICLTLDGVAITHVRCAKTAAEAWEALKAAFEDKGMGRRLALERKLYRLSLSDFENIEDKSIAAILLGGLTSKYEPLIMALENCNIDITSDLVKTKLLNEMSKNDTIPTNTVFQAKGMKSKPNEVMDSVTALTANFSNKDVW